MTTSLNANFRKSVKAQYMMMMNPEPNIEIVEAAIRIADKASFCSSVKPGIF